MFSFALACGLLRRQGSPDAGASKRLLRQIGVDPAHSRFPGFLVQFEKALMKLRANNNNFEFDFRARRLIDFLFIDLFIE